MLGVARLSRVRSPSRCTQQRASFHMLAYGQELPKDRIGPAAFSDQIKTELPTIREIFRTLGTEPL